MIEKRRGALGADPWKALQDEDPARPEPSRTIAGPHETIFEGAGGLVEGHRQKPCRFRRSGRVQHRDAEGHCKREFGPQEGLRRNVHRAASFDQKEGALEAAGQTSGLAEEPSVDDRLRKVRTRFALNPDVPADGIVPGGKRGFVKEKIGMLAEFLRQLRVPFSEINVDAQHGL